MLHLREQIVWEKGVFLVKSAGNACSASSEFRRHRQLQQNLAIFNDKQLISSTKSDDMNETR